MPDFLLEEAAGGTVVGIDEAGRGPWAGPVVAGAVILDRRTLPADLRHGLDDSKVLSRPRRDGLYEILCRTARIGIGRAKEMILGGDPIDAQTALAWGLANHVVPREQLLDKARELAGAIAANGPIAVRQAKKAMDRGANISLADGLVLEIEAYNVAMASEDRHEGINAFNEKRPPAFKNR